MNNLPEVKQYHLILVPVEGVHGGYVRVEDYRKLEAIAYAADLRLTTALEDVCSLRGKLVATRWQLDSKDTSLLQANRKLVEEARRSTIWLSISAVIAAVCLCMIWVVI